MADDETPRGPSFEDARDLLSRKPRKDILAGFLIEQSVACVWGLPGANKSLIVLSWLLSCAYGTSYNGKPARRGLAVYLAWEGAQRLTGERREAWRRYYRYEAAGIDGLKCQHFSDLADKDIPLRDIDLFTPTGRTKLAERIEADEPAYGKTTLVVLDTGTSLVQGMKRKHSQQAWTDVAVMARWLSNRLGCCVLVLLHAKKSGAEPAGAVSYLLQECDTIMHAVADPAGNRTMIEVEKQRGGPAGQKYMFDIVTVDLPPEIDPSHPSQPVAVLRGQVGAETSLRPASRREMASLERDGTWLMRLAMALEDGERSPPSPVLLRAWGDDGGEQFKRLRRLVPLDKGVTIHVPEQKAMKTITLVVEDSEERLCCTARPEVEGGRMNPAPGKSLEPVPDVEPADTMDGDYTPVPGGHMTPREARWFIWFSTAFSSSPDDERRYAMLLGNPRFPHHTQDREAGIRLLHDCVANSANDTVRERARIVLGKLGIEVPPPIAKEPEDKKEPPPPPPPTEKRRGGWPKGKPRGPRRTLTP